MYDVGAIDHILWWAQSWSWILIGQYDTKSCG